MKKIEVTPFDIAQRFVGIKEISGTVSNPQILYMLNLDQEWPKDDSVPWCSAFTNYVCWILRLPRSKDLRARSWLNVGQEVELKNAETGFDIVVLRRGEDPQPGPDVIDAPGHVGFFAGYKYAANSSGSFSVAQYVSVLGGNQSDSVKISNFMIRDILAIKRIS